MQKNTNETYELPKLRYSGLEEYWIGNLPNGLELLIAGSEDEPNPIFLELARHALTLIDAFRGQAQNYLRAFTLPELVSGVARNDSLEFGIDRTLPNEFDAAFNIDPDTYGRWRVRIRLDNQGLAHPVGFSRRNH